MTPKRLSQRQRCRNLPDSSSSRTLCRHLTTQFSDAASSPEPGVRPCSRSSYGRARGSECSVGDAWLGPAASAAASTPCTGRTGRTGPARVCSQSNRCKTQTRPSQTPKAPADIPSRETAEGSLCIQSAHKALFLFPLSAFETICILLKILLSLLLLCFWQSGGGRWRHVQLTAGHTQISEQGDPIWSYKSVFVIGLVICGVWCLPLKSAVWDTRGESRRKDLFGHRHDDEAPALHRASPGKGAHTQNSTINLRLAHSHFIFNFLPHAHWQHDNGNGGNQSWLSSSGNFIERKKN